MTAIVQRFMKLVDNELALRMARRAQHNPNVKLPSLLN
jgi:hypothetical protein